MFSYEPTGCNNNMSLKFSILILCLMLMSLSATPVCADDSSWVLSQESTVFGPTKAYIGKKAGKVVYTRQNCEVLCNGPTGSIVYNEHKKLFYVTNGPNDSIYRRLGFLSSFSEKLENLDWQRGDETVIAGCRARRYFLKKPASYPSMLLAEYWEAEDIPIKPSISDSCSRLLHVPSHQHALLRVQHTTYARKTVVFDTVKVERRDLGKDFFTVPKDYKPTKSFIDVSASGDLQEIMQNVTDSLGAGASRASSKDHRAER